jgi:GH24 family phage-related lysozyme (muramidase)
MRHLRKAFLNLFAFASTKAESTFGSPYRIGKKRFLLMSLTAGILFITAPFAHAQGTLYTQYNQGKFTFAIQIIPRGPGVNWEKANREAKEFLAAEKKNVEEITTAAVAKRDVATLEKLLKERNYQPRLGGAQALGDIYATEAITSLIKLVNSEHVEGHFVTLANGTKSPMFMDSLSRAAAAEALGKMGADAKDAIPTFTKLLENKAFLGARGNEVAVEAVKKSLEKIKADIPARDRLRQQLATHEGREKKAYKDTMDIPTIGVGFNLNRKDAKAKIEALGLDYARVMEGKQELNDAQIDKLLEADITGSIANCRSVFPKFSELSEVRQRVLSDMMFNLGKDKFEGFTKMIAAVKSGDFTKAADEMKQSDWYNQVKERGKKLEKMMRENKDPDPKSSSPLP